MSKFIKLSTIDCSQNPTAQLRKYNFGKAKLGKTNTGKTKIGK